MKTDECDLLPIVLSLLPLAAHFCRAELVAVSIVCVALPLLFFLRESWVSRLVQFLLVLGSLEWLRALYGIAAMRIAFGESRTRLTLILGAVALFTGLSGLVFRNRERLSRCVVRAP